MICAQLLVLVLLLVPLFAADIEQTWVISLKSVNPDGVSKVVPVVNGQYPGPELRGRVGQTVEIRVENHLPTESTTIHWHGIKQTGTAWSDGVPGITQCPISPGDSFVYRFKLEDAGTLWWHSHSGLQKSSLYGALIVTGDEDVVGKYPEHTLLLNDWFHDSSDVQLEGLLNPDFRWVGNPNTLLINGRGAANCTEAAEAGHACDPDHPDANAGPFVMDVQPDTTYRLRLVGTSSLVFLSVDIMDHKIKLMETETSLLKPLTVTRLELSSGQSYSALLKTKSREELRKTRSNNGLFWIVLQVKHRDVGELYALAVMRYSNAAPSATKPRGEPYFHDEDASEIEETRWSLRLARAMRMRERQQVPRRADRTLSFMGTQNRLQDGRLGWALNNVSFGEEFGASPLLHSVKLGVKQDTDQYVEQSEIIADYDNVESIALIGAHVVKVKLGEVVDFIFQNGATLSGEIETHPW